MFWFLFWLAGLISTSQRSFSGAYTSTILIIISSSLLFSRLNLFFTFANVPIFLIFLRKSRWVHNFTRLWYFKANQGRLNSLTFNFWNWRAHHWTVYLQTFISIADTRFSRQPFPRLLKVCPQFWFHHDKKSRSTIVARWFDLKTWILVGWFVFCKMDTWQIYD